MLHEEQAVDGQESVPDLGLYLLVGYGFGARRPYAPTGEPAGASSVGPGTPFSCPRKTPGAPKCCAQPDLMRTTSPALTCTPASRSAEARSSSVMPYPPGSTSTLCSPATSSSIPRQTSGSMVSTPSTEKRPPCWASCAGLPPCRWPL